MPIAIVAPWPTELPVGRMEGNGDLGTVVAAFGIFTMFMWLINGIISQRNDHTNISHSLSYYGVHFALLWHPFWPQYN
jgi:hypothetical protein